MACREQSDKATRVSKESVSKQFVRLFYSILNTHHDYLFQFYGSNSTVVVSEMMDGGKAMTETADDEESVRALLKSLYADVTVKVDTAVPQLSLNGSVLLLVTGTMFRKGYDDERIFTQALLLAPQENGYYILTDSLHVLGRSQTNPIVGRWNEVLEDSWGLFNDGTDGSGSIIPRTPRADFDNTVSIGMHPSIANKTDTPIPINFSGRDLATVTPPPQEISLEQNKSSESDGEGDEFTRNSSHTMLGNPMNMSLRSQVQRQAIVPTIHTIPSLSMGSLHLGPYQHGIGLQIGVGVPPPRPLRRRSMSMGSDPRVMHTPPGHGVFIARLPFGVQAEDVAEAFAQFGQIIGGGDGIQVRDGRNGCYAFVTFESAVSAQSAIQKGAVVQGKRVYVEPRYPRQEGDTAYQLQGIISAPNSAHLRPSIPLPRRAT